MAMTYIYYTGDGTTNEFLVPFDYIKKDYVKFYIDEQEVDSGEVTWDSDTQVSFAVPPSNGSKILIKRETEIEEPLVDFRDGSTLTEDELDMETAQLLHLIQEGTDNSTGATKVLTQTLPWLVDSVDDIKADSEDGFYHIGSYPNPETARYDASGYPVTATGSTAARTLQERFADVVNVKDFGAKGDGVTDDTEAIQAAITAHPSGCIFFPSGTYIVSSSIVASGSDNLLPGLVLASDARLKASDDFELGDYLIRLGTAPSAGVMSKSGGIFGGIFDTNNRASGIIFLGPAGCAFENIRIHNLKYTGIRIYEGDGADKVADVYMRNIFVYCTSIGQDLTPVTGSVSTQIAIILNGTDNNIANIRTAGGQCGIQILSGGQFIKDAHVTTHSDECSNYDNTIGFDLQYTYGNCVFESCYADNFRVGWKLLAQHAVFNNCEALWYSNGNAKHICFMCADSGEYFAGKVFGFKVTFPTNGDNYILYSTKTESRVAWFDTSPDRGSFIAPVITYDQFTKLKHPFSELALANCMAEYDTHCSHDNSVFTANKWYAVASFMIATFSGGYATLIPMRISSKDFEIDLELGVDGNTPYFYISNAKIIRNLGGATFVFGIGKLNDCFTDQGGTAVSSFMLFIKVTSATSMPSSKMAVNAKPNGTFMMYHWSKNIASLGLISGYFKADSIPNQIGSDMSLVDTYRPALDNTTSLGTATQRYSTVYAATGSINTSDEREKSNVSEIESSLFEAWGKVDFKLFQFNDAIEEKGETARLHVGVVAQDVSRAFASCDIDARRFGLFCYDEWGQVVDTKTVVDKDGYVDSETGKTVPPQTHSESFVVQEAGSRYGIRYEEALALECAYQRWLGEQRDRKIAELESKLKELTDSI